MVFTSDELLARLEQAATGDNLPPVDQWHPENVGQIDIRIDASGQWWHQGSRFRRDSLVRLFARIMRREAEGYYLVTPVEKLRIEVEDAPFVAVDLDVAGEAGGTDLLFTTNVGDLVMADAAHPLFVRDGKPYVVVRGGLEAKLTTAVYYRLAEYAVSDDDEGQEQYVVASRGSRFPLAFEVAAS